MSKLTFNYEIVNTHTYRFYCKDEERRLSELIITHLKKAKKKFDIEFLFEGSIGFYLNEEERVFKRSDVRERIQEYKKIDPLIVPFIKIIIYGAEKAYKMYLEESLNLKKLNLQIKSVEINFSTSKEVLLYTVMNAVWWLLDFTPKNKLEISLSKKNYNTYISKKTPKQVYVENIYEVVILSDIPTEYVLRDMSIDESLTNDFYLLGEVEKFEKGRQYQWLI